MANYTIDLDSKNVVVNANYDKNFTSIDKIDFGGCNLSFTSAFSGSSNLASVKNGTVTDADITALFKDDTALSDLSDLKFSGVQIAVSAFATCTNLLSVDLSDSETTLVSLASAFRDCGIAELNLQNSTSLTSINRTFRDTQNLTSVTLNGSAIVDAEGAFGNQKLYSKVMTINLGTDLSKLQIGKQMFASGNVSNTDFTYELPSLTNADAMFNTTNFVDVSVYGTSALTDAHKMYQHSSVSSVTMDQVGSILSASEMFADCKNLVEYNVPADFTAMTSGNDMFLGCTSLKSVALNCPKNTTCYNMFSGCTALTAITLPNLSSVMTTTNMFADCTNVTSLKAGHLSSRVWDFSNMVLDDESTTYIADNTDTAMGTSAKITFNDAVSANTNYYTAYTNLTSKGWTVTPVASKPSVTTVEYSDIDGLGMDGIEVVEA